MIKKTFPWLLQERFPQYEVVNFGLNGYSTVQSLIQLREALGRAGSQSCRTGVRQLG